MQVVSTRLTGPLLLAPQVHADSRGFFAETFRTSTWEEAGVRHEWVQDNHSRSRRGALRGLHFQTQPGQAKLIRCARGEIYDVVVDLRRGSPTFGEWEAHELDDREMRQLYIPVGFAHGFCVVSEQADVVYKCSTYYEAATEGSLAWDDPEVGIDWPDDEPTVSERDAGAPRLAEIADALPFRYQE
jgi:dTDP-4-dehydrorhamnose 3,5-epimerase